MPECDFVAAAFLCFMVKMSSAHFRAQVAGISVDLFGDIKNICVKNLNRQLKQLRVLLYLQQVFFVVTRVHHEKNLFKRHLAVSLKHLHQLCEQH